MKIRRRGSRNAGDRHGGRKTIDEMIKEYAATLMKEGFQPEVIADKFMSLGAGLFETMNGTAATAARLEAAAKALRDGGQGSNGGFGVPHR